MFSFLALFLEPISYWRIFSYVRSWLSKLSSSCGSSIFSTSNTSWLSWPTFISRSSFEAEKYVCWHFLEKNQNYLRDCLGLLFIDLHLLKKYLLLEFSGIKFSTVSFVVCLVLNFFALLFRCIRLLKANFTIPLTELKWIIKNFGTLIFPLTFRIIFVCSSLNCPSDAEEFCTNNVLLQVVD